MQPSVDLSHGPPRVSENGRFLVHEDGTPFFYLGDTAWELFHRCTVDEARAYLEDRARKRFTVIQAVVLAELDGLHTPNACGELPLVDDDPDRPNEAYFAHVDALVHVARDLGLFIGMLPTWGDKWHKKWGVGPVVFTPDNAKTYGAFLGERYRGEPIIWVLGGDRNPDEAAHVETIRAMAAGLASGDAGEHLMTFHPQGGASSSRWFHDEPWLDFNMLQSGHAARDVPNYEMVQADYARRPPKPCLDGEPPYEDHPINWSPANGWFDDYDVRKHAYWAVFAGAHGHTYGCHDIWQMYAPGREPVSAARTPWPEALALPGSDQVRHLRALMESRPFLTRVPAQDVVAWSSATGGGHVQAAACAEGRCAMAYLPLAAQHVAVNPGRLGGGPPVAWWYDPRSGQAAPAHPDTHDEGHPVYRSPDSGPDWVLVLDHPSQGFSAPGQPV